MKRSITVTSHVEGDALARVLDVPSIRAAQIITGLLLELDDTTRHRVMTMVENSIALARATEHSDRVAHIGEQQPRLAMADAGSSGD